MVVIETHAKDVASERIRLPGVIVVVDGLLIRRRRIRVRARQESRVELVQRVGDAIRGNYVVREWIANDMSRPRRIRTRRQRIVDLVLRRIRQQEEIREVARQMVVAGITSRKRPVGVGRLAVEIISSMGVVDERKQLVPAVDDPRNKDRAAEGQRQIMREPLFVRLPCARIPVEHDLLKPIRRVELVRPVPGDSPCRVAHWYRLWSSSRCRHRCHVRSTR